MKEELLTTLRNRHTSCEIFRKTANQLGSLIAAESGAFLQYEKCSIDTPLAKTQGQKLLQTPTIVPILRAGTALLPAFLSFYPDAPIGFIGIRREEQTAKPLLYYTNLPSMQKQTPVFLLDPMLATGQSASLAIQLLKEKGVIESHIVLFSILAAEEGVQLLKKQHPQVHTSIVHVDKDLNDAKWIVPGLGDFGDRYFGT